MKCPAHFGMHDVECQRGCVDRCVMTSPAPTPTGAADPVAMEPTFGMLRIDAEETRWSDSGWVTGAQAASQLAGLRAELAEAIIQRDKWHSRWETEVAAIAKRDGWVLVPVEPPEGLLMSMAIRSDHGLGCPGYYDQDLLKWDGVTHAQRVQSAIGQMRQLYEEVVGQGFYQPAKEDEYKAMIAASPDAGQGG